MTFRVGAVLIWTAALNFAHKREPCCQCVPLYHSYYCFMVPWDHQQLYFSKEFHRDCHSTQCVVCRNVLDLRAVLFFFILTGNVHSDYVFKSTHRPDTGQLSFLCVDFLLSFFQCSTVAYFWEELQWIANIHVNCTLLQSALFKSIPKCQ